MFYKLSNTANHKEIEEAFNVKFEFPKLYKPMPVINGLEESNLPIITMEDPGKVKFAIWGLLPESLEENWEVFQKFTNTLNIKIEGWDCEDSLYSECLDTRRCIILSTGFFTSALHEGKMYPHHVHLEHHKPFGIAGVYNRLDDGFITCSILIKKTVNELGDIPNLLDYKPVIFDTQDFNQWLDRHTTFDNLKDLIRTHNTLQYHSQPVSKDFYDTGRFHEKPIKENPFQDYIKTS